MGYVIRKLPTKKSDPKWKLQYCSRKKIHANGRDVKHPSRTWDIPQSRWSGIGIRKDMSFAEARERCVQLNAKLAIKRNEEKRIEHQERIRELNQIACAFLPEVYKDEFEDRYFYSRCPNRVLKNKELSHWRAAQALIKDVKLEPSEWFDECLNIYDWIAERQYSVSYYRRILRVLNTWGFFISRKLDRPFIPVSMPRGLERARLLDAHYKKDQRGKSSDPLLPLQLEAAKAFLKESCYNWLYISVWFGLRPKEIDNLRKNSKITIDERGKTIVWVYQTKITSIPPLFRWKPIPVLLPQQMIAVKMIKSGRFHRPISKTIKKYLGKKHTLYGGRKGFTDLMIQHGQRLENIAQWLGHSSIDRTWKHYKDKLRVHYDELKAA